MRNKYTVLAACTLALFATGMNYVWGVFQVPVMQYYGVGSNAASRVFYLFVTFNVIGIFTGGRICDRTGPQIPTLVGACLYLAGLFASSFVPQDRFSLLYLTYSALLSFGGGIVYPCATACAQAWWPEKRGFATGVVLSMLGVSTLVFTPIINALIASDPARVPFCFRVLGIAFSVLLAAACYFIRLPQRGAGQAVQPVIRKDSAVRDILKSKAYYLLLFCVAVGPIGYYTVNPIAKILGAERGLSESLIVTMIMASGIGSALGRLVCGKLSDNIGARNMFSILFCVSMGCSLGLAFARGIAFYALVVLLTFAFGGFAGITPSLGVEYFGSENVGTVISMLSVAILISSFASPAIVSALATPQGDLTIWNFVICAILALAGLVVCRLNRSDRSMAGRSA